MANGLFTNVELVDTIIVDLNSIIKNVMTGQYLQVCSQISAMAQKLVNLRTGIENEMKSRNETIETLKQELRAVGENVVDISSDELIELMEKGDSENEK